MQVTSPKHIAKPLPFHSPVFTMSLFSRLLKGRATTVATLLVILLGEMCIFTITKWGVWLVTSLGKPKLPQKSNFLFSIWGYRFFPPLSRLTLKIKNLILFVWRYLRFYYCSMRTINPICMRFLRLLSEVFTTAVGGKLVVPKPSCDFLLGLFFGSTYPRAIYSVVYSTTGDYYWILYIYLTNCIITFTSYL